MSWNQLAARTELPWWLQLGVCKPPLVTLPSCCYLFFYLKASLEGTFSTKVHLDTWIDKRGYTIDFYWSSEHSIGWCFAVSQLLFIILACCTLIQKSPIRNQNYVYHKPFSTHPKKLSLPENISTRVRCHPKDGIFWKLFLNPRS